MAFQAPVVLKARHSLIGRSLIPVIIRLKAWDGEDVNFARLKKEYPLEDYSIVELRMEFERLTGESAKDVLTLAGREEDLEGHVMRLLVHFAIEHANSVGAPKGQTLGEAVPIGTGMAAGTAASSGVGGVASSTLAKQGSSGTGGMVSSSNSNTGTPVSGGGKETKSAGVGSMEEQLRSMRTDLEALKSRRDGLQVDEALSNVRSLASRPNLTSPNVLMAAIETLIEVANKANYKEASMFSKAYAICKRYEGNDDFCGLVLKLFGSQEDKKIASIIADWAKSKKYEEGEKGKGKQKENNGLPVSPYPQFPYPSPYPMHMPYQNMGMYTYPASQPFPGPRPMRHSFKKGKQGGNCFYCKEPGHFVSNCPKLQGKKE